jgi:glycosyltransferase involved in cell wall biosynthesis
MVVRMAKSGRLHPSPSSDPPVVAVLIPALDEERALPLVLRDLPRASAAGALAFRVREIIVVDNGSTDGTADAARAAGATVILEPRRGYGAACLAGLSHLASVPPTAVVFLDADHSDDPAELPDVLAPILRGEADLVIGSRVCGTLEPGALTPLQAFGNRLAGALLRGLFGVRATDLGPFRAIRWEALERLRMRDRDYGWTVEMQARAARAGLRVAEVAVRYRRRAAGRSKVSGTLSGVLGAGWKILFTIARVRLGG